MRKVIFICIAAVSLLFTACEKDIDISISLTWEDSEYYELNDGWKAAIYEGALSFVSDSDYDETPLEVKDVSVNDAAVVFTVGISGYTNHTVAVFNDLNGNGKYDSGENASVDFGSSESDEVYPFELEVSY